MSKAKIEYSKLESSGSDQKVSSGFLEGDLVNLMHGDEDKAAFTACAEHVRESSKFGSVMYKMLMGLLVSTSREVDPEMALVNWICISHASEGSKSRYDGP